MDAVRARRIPSIDSRGEVMMGLIQRPLRLVGSRGERRVPALFDSGATFSVVRRDIAQAIAHLEVLPEPLEFGTAEVGASIVSRHRISVNFYFDDTPRLFEDSIFVLDSLAEPLIIGAKTMQAWRIKLDLEGEDVLYDKTVHRLRL